MQTLETERLKYWAEVIMLDPRFCGATGQGAYWAVASEQVNQAAAQILTDRETDMRLEKVAAAKRTKRTKKTATRKTENLDVEGFEPVQQALDLGSEDSSEQN